MAQIVLQSQNALSRTRGFVKIRVANAGTGASAREDSAGTIANTKSNQMKMEILLQMEMKKKKKKKKKKNKNVSRIIFFEIRNYTN